MAVTATTGVTANAAAQAAAAAKQAAAAKSATVDYNTFLQILMAEMKNQDPTKPTDPTQFISQLSSFSAVEQQVNTNSKLDALIAASGLSEADRVIGRVVTSADGKISGEVASVRLGQGAPTAILTDGRELQIGAGVVVSAR